MNISKVAQSNTVAVNTSTPHSIVGELQKQKMELTKQIETVKGSNEDAKAKAEKIKTINAQIEELNKQIQEAQMEEQKKEMEKAQQQNAAKAAQQKYDNADESEKTGVVLSASLNNLLSAKMDNSDLKDMNRIRVKLRGEMNIGQSEIKQSAQNGGDTRYQMDAVSKKGSQLAKVASDMEKKIGEIDKHIDEAVKVGIDEAERERGKQQDNVDEKDKNDTGAPVSGQEQVGKDITNQVEPPAAPITTPVTAGAVAALTEIEKNKKNENDKESTSTAIRKPIDIFA